MTTLSLLTAASPAESSTPPLPVRITKSLLGYGVIAGPFYVLVSVAQGLTREGFDFTRHAWSLLANGPWGWIHTTNLILTGAMVLAFAVGLRRALAGGRGGTWAPLLVGAYGLSMVGAAIFRADPVLGFPPGTPETVAEPTVSGLLHLMIAGVGFLALIVVCLILGARFAAEGRRGWAWFSRVTGVAFLAGFAGVASGGGSAALNLAFTAAIVLVWAWMSAVAVHLYRRTV
jgi:hypothetical membrane protein